MNAESWKLILAFGGLFLTTITGPVLWALIAEGRRFKAEMEGLENRLMMRMMESEKAILKETGEIKVRLQRLEDRAGIVHRG